MRGSSGWDIPQRQATNLSPVGHEAVIAPSPPRQQEHFEPPALVAAAVPGVISAQLSVVSPGRDCTSSDRTRMNREMTAICPICPTREPHGRFTRAYRSVYRAGLFSPNKLRMEGEGNRSRHAARRAMPNLFPDAFGQVWSICTPLAALKTRFPPIPVNDPCQSHTHRATPRVVRQPSETVLYREFRERPRTEAFSR